MGNCEIDMKDSELAGNMAFGGLPQSLEAKGGGMSIENSESRLERVAFRGNSAHSAALATGGAAYLAASKMALTASSVVGNTAANTMVDATGAQAMGGAFSLDPPSQLDITFSQLSDNEVAAAGTIPALGGALFASAGQSKVTVVRPHREPRAGLSARGGRQHLCCVPD